MSRVLQRLATAVAAALLYVPLSPVATPAQAGDRAAVDDVIININSGPRCWEQPNPDDPCRVGITLSERAAVAVTVRLVTADGTAVAPGDYATVDQEVTVPAGDPAVEVVLRLVDDGAREGAERFAASISSPSAGRIGVGLTEVVIEDGSPPGGG